MSGPIFAAIGIPIAAALSLAALTAPIKHAGGACKPGASVGLRIAATTDVHGHIRGWDYYGNRPDTIRGLARAATIVDSVRNANPERVVLVDAGDMLQGTPLTYVAARKSRSRINPVIATMNVMHYDAVVIGNHEFNYGVPYLDSAIAQARFPLLAANVMRNGKLHGFASMTIVRRDGVTVGIIGATTPGSNLWDGANLKRAGVRVGDIVPAVRREVSQAKQSGVDVIIVVLHSGLNEPSTYDTLATKLPSENVAARVAAEISGINAVIYGHSHKENKGQLIGATLVVQPRNWATSVAIVDVPVTCNASGRWIAAAPTSQLVQSAGHKEQAAVRDVVGKLHEETLAYVNSAIGSTPTAWLSDSARVRPTGIIGFVAEVERRTAKADIASASAFDMRARLGPGPITVAQIAQLYPYENTLRAVRITGAQLKAYLEHSSRYYQTNTSGALIPDTTVAGYDFDIVRGVSYTIDVTKPVGERIGALAYHGKPVGPTDTFVMALNNYRQSGGGGYAMLRDAPVVYDRQQDIRQLLIEEVQRLHEIREADFDSRNWSFVRPTRPR